MTISGQAQASYRRAYPQSGKAVGRARRDVIDFARQFGFSARALDDIEAAVGEGLANAVEHAVRSEGGFEVNARYADGALVVEIKDHGGGFDHASICANAGPPAEALRGFGTFIMRELMDEVRYSDFGTRLRLIKRLPAAGERDQASMRATQVAPLAVHESRT